MKEAEKPKKRTLTYRLPEDLRVKLEGAAKLAGESLNSEITRRLERTFHSDEITSAFKQGMVAGRMAALIGGEG